MSGAVPPRTRLRGICKKNHTLTSSNFVSVCRLVGRMYSYASWDGPIACRAQHMDRLIPEICT